jgi:hypothetical protein
MYARGWLIRIRICRSIHWTGSSVLPLPQLLLGIKGSMSKNRFRVLDSW